MLPFPIFCLGDHGFTRKISEFKEKIKIKQVYHLYQYIVFLTWMNFSWAKNKWNYGRMFPKNLKVNPFLANVITLFPLKTRKRKVFLVFLEVTKWVQCTDMRWKKIMSPKSNALRRSRDVYSIILIDHRVKTTTIIFKKSG